jgi:hypothetical protein
VTVGEALVVVVSEVEVDSGPATPTVWLLVAVVAVCRVLVTSRSTCDAGSADDRDARAARTVLVDVLAGTVESETLIEVLVATGSVCEQLSTYGPQDESGAPS